MKTKFWGTQFYNVFRAINYRCNYPTSKNYFRYGGRGIKNLWESDEDFKRDMYESYLKHVEEFGEKNTSIERIDNDGNYCKENCKWATRKEQLRNRRNTIFYTHKGKTQTLNDWSLELGISRQTIIGRIKVLGWSIEKALSTPVIHL